MSGGDRRSGGGSSPFSRVDEQIVPSLQRGARRVLRFVGAPLRGLRRWEQRVAGGRLLSRLYGNRGLVLFAAVAIAFLASAVHFQRYPDLRVGARDTPAAPAPGDDDAVGGEPGDGASEGPVAVGPTVGTEIGGYVSERQAALADLPGDVEEAPAVVSFGEYRTAEHVASTIPTDAEVTEVQYRLPAEGERPVSLPVAEDGLVEAVGEAVEAARSAYAEEEDEVERLLASDTIEDEEFLEDLERRLSEVVAVRNLLDSGAPIVFAVVVRAPVPALRALSEHGDVRLVDVAPPGADPDRTVFYGVLPEDREVATYGRQP